MGTSNATFHSLCAGAAATGGLMLATGGELGAYAPILIALGLYLLVFVGVAEAVYLGQGAVRHVVRRFWVERPGQSRAARVVEVAPR